MNLMLAKRGASGGCGAPQPPEAPRFASIKFIQYDFKKYGSSAERKRLLEKWEKDVNSIPR